MAKKSFYFPHDCNARNDDKLIAVRMRHKMEGYGVYFAIIEKLVESSDYKSTKDYNIIAFDLHVDSKLVKSIIEDFSLFEFTDDGKFFFSSSLRQRLKPLENLREQRRQAGKKSAEKRAKANDNSTTVERPLSKTETDIVDKSIEDNKEILSKESTKKEDKSSLPTPEISDFEKFNLWIKANAPYCSNIKNFTKQLTEEEFSKLKKSYTGSQISEIILQIENRKDLRKRYTHLYRTVLNWAKKEYGE